MDMDGPAQAWWYDNWSRRSGCPNCGRYIKRTKSGKMYRHKNQNKEWCQ